VKLRGISIGNGFIDPYYSLNYPEFLYDLGFIDEKQKFEASLLVDRIRKLIRRQEYSRAFQVNNTEC